MYAKHFQKWAIFALAVVAIIVGSGTTRSQIQPYKPPQKYKSSVPGPASYTDYYTSRLQTYHRPPRSVSEYTIDKYYYTNPNLSPYLNLARTPSPDRLNNYHRYVRPELERRDRTPSASAGMSNRGPSLSSPAATGFSTAPAATPGLPTTGRTGNAYYHKYFGSGLP